MASLLGTIKFDKGMYSCICSCSLANKFNPLQLARFSSTTATFPNPNPENPNQDSFPANYLKTTYGFLPEKALLYSKYLNFDSPARPDSVTAFFKSHHFSDAQISNMVRKWPIVFRQVPESSFSPKILYLQSLGFSSSDIVKILVLEPSLLGRSLESQIIPCVDFLRSFLKSDRDVMFSILRYPRIFREKFLDTFVPNAEILRGAGVPDDHIASLLKISPRRLAVDPESFRVIVEEAKKLGLKPWKKIFIIGITVMRELSSASWREKINCYKRWGFSEDQILDAFRKYPRFMAVSEDKISRIMEFFVKEMGGNFSAIINRPSLMSLSFESNIVPRFAVYQFLLSKRLVKQDISLSQVLGCPQRLFLDRYVLRYAEEAPEILKVYQESLNPLKEIKE